MLFVFLVLAVGLDQDVGQDGQVDDIPSVGMPRHVVDLVLYVCDRLAQVSVTPLSLLEAHLAALESTCRTGTDAGRPLSDSAIRARLKAKIIFL